MRPSKRAPNEMRQVSLERAVARYAEGSCFVKFGNTHVLCTASLEDKPPMWLRGQGRGWITAEYSMLPRATNSRTKREVNAGKPSGRTQEIQRLIGRSLRAVVDLQALGRAAFPKAWLCWISIMTKIQLLKPMPILSSPDLAGWLKFRPQPKAQSFRKSN